MVTKGSHSRVLRIVATPFRALVKAKNLYVRGMTSCAGSAAFNGAAGCSASDDGVYALPRSLSRASSVGSAGDNEDFRELVRAASARSLGHTEIDVEAAKQRVGAAMGGVPRSCSVGMARIDEDEASAAFEDGGDAKLGGAGRKRMNSKKSSVFPRSRSYAVQDTGRVF